MLRRLSATLLMTTAPALADTPKVVADFAPVHSLVSQVMGDLGAPDLLMPQNGDPHAFQMRPSQARALADADLVFWVGPEMTPWLDRALNGINDDATAIALMESPGTLLRESSHVHDHSSHGDDDGHGGHDDHDGHDHDKHDHKEDDHKHEEHDHDDHKHDDHDHDDHDDKHDHGDAHDHDDHAHHNDPHAWLSPANGAVWLNVIAQALSAADPDNAPTYQDNAAKARDALQALDAQLAQQLEPVRDQGFVVFHDAYGYFTDHYKLTYLGSIRDSDSAKPSAARVSAVTDLLKSKNVRCVFSEAAEEQDMMMGLIENTDIGTGVLDPAGSQLTLGAGLYNDLLRSQAETISTCLNK